MLAGQNVFNSVVAGNSSRGIGSHAREYGEVFNNQLHFTTLGYDELEERNLAIREKRLAGMSQEEFFNEFSKVLSEEKGVKAVTLCFTDMEGRLQLLDYDKKYLLSSHDNLTFDGSSIRGFTPQDKSDLRLWVDWSSLRWLPADIFGPGKVLVFANACDQDGNFYGADFRSKLSDLSEELSAEGVTVNLAPEVEGFLFNGANAEQNFMEATGFDLVTLSSYFNCLPQDTLRLFIDKLAEVQRALGFMNEKDHPEVAPSQFEVNYRYSIALDAADQIQLYKLCARQIAKFMGFTASFLPKPIAGMNGSGMHCNLSLSKNGVNLFFDPAGKEKLSGDAWKFISGVLHHANDLCLVMNSSVNAYRRLDPRYEAPNEIKVSSKDRGSMIRIPIGNEKSARVEVRTVAPDVNPYLCTYAILKAGLKGIKANEMESAKYMEVVNSTDVKKLPGEISGAIEHFEKSEFMKDIMGQENHAKYVELKREAADRSPKLLGARVKTGEVIYHHEVTNQMIWKSF